MWTWGDGRGVQKEGFTKIVIITGMVQLCCFILGFDDHESIKIKEIYVDSLRGDVK
jgi:hypothetical protein